MAIESITVVGCGEQDSRQVLVTLTACGYEVTLAKHLGDAAPALSTSPCDLLIVSATVLDRPGLRAAEDLRAMLPELPIVIAGTERDAATFALMLKIGACDFIHCPVDAPQLRLLVERLGEHRRLIDENHYLWDELERVYGCDGLVSRDPSMAEVLREATRVARTDTTVLIQGEEGTEHELVALYIHRSSERQSGPFIRLNCRGISPQQCARELFGWESAKGKHPGRIELAAGGSLYLEEITALPLPVQGRLLRVIDEGGYEREGGGQPVASRARVIASTSCDPYEKMRDGELREDLFFRLNVVPIFLPPLRKRPGDIPLLADHFARKFGSGRGAAELVGADQWARMTQYPWPGNVDELEGTVKLAVLRDRRRAVGLDDPWEDDL